MPQQKAVNPKLLTSAEHKEYDRRQRIAREVGRYPLHVTIKELPDDARRRVRGVDYRAGAVGCILTAAATVAGGLSYGSSGAIAVGVCTVIGVFFVAYFTRMTLLFRMARRWADGYLDEIGYHDRALPAPRSADDAAYDGGDSWKYPVTDGVKDPALYRARGGYSTKRAMESLGITDYDIYRSNVAD